MKEKALNYLGLMRKAGMLELGETGAGAAVKSGKAKLLLLAPDAGENSKHRAESFVYGRNTQLVVLPFTRDELSKYVGKANTVMAAVTDGGFAEAFMNTLAAIDPKYEEQARLTADKNRRAAQRKQGMRRNDA